MCLRWIFEELRNGRDVCGTLRELLIVSMFSVPFFCSTNGESSLCVSQP